MNYKEFEGYIPTLGIETHFQLNCKSKLFSSAPNTRGENNPNESVNALDAGIPGILPKVNKVAIDKAIMLGIALKADISKDCFFERKTYFYPDLPKGYQTSQLENPIIQNGTLTILTEEGTKDIVINRAHLEEDAGKLIHNQDNTLVDLNRSGKPLIEIVSNPNIHSIEEAINYLKSLRQLMLYLNISYADLYLGEMRFDINISLAPKSSNTLGTKTEIKNLNSFRFAEKAIYLEIKRQLALILQNKEIKQQTIRYDEANEKVYPIRFKEDSMDYRYFPCPDLLPIEISQDYINSLQKQLPKLPAQYFIELTQKYKINPKIAIIIIDNIQCLKFLNAAIAIKPQYALNYCNWIQNELLPKFQESKELKPKIQPQHLVDIIELINNNTISNKVAKAIINDIYQSGKSVTETLKKLGLKQINSTEELEAIIKAIIKNNPNQVEVYKNSDPNKQSKLISFFMGQLMQKTKGKANPKIAKQIILDNLK